MRAIQDLECCHRRRRFPLRLFRNVKPQESWLFVEQRQQPADRFDFGFVSADVNQVRGVEPIEQLGERFAFDGSRKVGVKLGRTMQGLGRLNFVTVPGTAKTD